MKICPNCHAENEDYVSFCQECGTSLADVPIVKMNGESGAEQASAQPVQEKNVAETEPLLSKTKVCRYCGAVNDIENVFCADCGHRFEPEKVAVAQPSQVEAIKQSGAARVESTPAPQVMPTQTGSTGGGQVPPTQNGSTGGSGQLPPLPPQQQRATPSPKKPLSTKKKVGIIAAIVVIILAAVGYKFGTAHFSRDNQLDSFITAINAGDATKVAQVIHSEDTNLTVSTDSVKPFITYFKENKAELNNLKQALKADASYFGVNFTKNGKKFLIFDNYMADVASVYGAMTTNVKDAEISFDEKKVATSDSAEFSRKFGPILPGLYAIKAVGKDSSGKEMTLSTKPILKADDSNELDLTFTMVVIPIESNIADATVMINGKDAGQLEEGAATIGPMLFEKGMKVQLVKKTTDGELKSEEAEISAEDFPADAEDNYPLELDFDVADADDVQSGLFDFYDDFSDAVETFNAYDPASFAAKYYENGQKNEGFTGIGEYIASCRARYDKKEYQGVYFEIEVTSVTPTAQDAYTVNYHVIYHTSYPYETKKDTRVEGFDYSNVKIKLTEDEDDYDWEFMFVDMGDGGVKVSDNHPELK